MMKESAAVYCAPTVVQLAELVLDGSVDSAYFEGVPSSEVETNNVTSGHTDRGTCSALSVGQGDGRQGAAASGNTA